MPDRLGELGDLQLSIMQILWRKAPVTVHEVVAALPEDRKSAYTTVLTVLRNLEKRELVTHDTPDGERMFRYRPIVSVDATRQAALLDLMHRQFDGSPALLLTHLLDRNICSTEDLRVLRRLIDARLQGVNGSSA